MQTGISFAAGQLLAVVAPRTVLVVDAPTDWSLAGPLWELALDDAPVDEILDVLIRRGIRTAPSFAIVRVENDAVRALVRGSVPVCFERAGEPVRLDATGATSWLEGLISGARRVLVGAVDVNTPLPYLVSTGVVLVSGLALPTGVDAQDQVPPAFTSASPAPGTDPGADPGQPGSPVPAPVPAGPVMPERVVDLTRSASRTPVRSYAGEGSRESQSWPVGQRAAEPSPENGYPAINGHAPSVVAPPLLPPVSNRSQPIDLPIQLPDPAGVPAEAPSGVPAELGSLAAPDLEAEAAAPAVAEIPADVVDAAGPAIALEPAVLEPSVLEPSVLEPVARQAEPAPSDAPAPFDPPAPFDAPDPFAPPVGLREPSSSDSLPSFDALVSPAQGLDHTEVPGDEFSAAPVESEGVPEDEADEPRRSGEADSSDLLVDVEPVGPSPADLPNFDPPSLSLPLPPVSRYAPDPAEQAPGYELPSRDSSSTGLGAPAAWPPVFPVERANGAGEAPINGDYQNPFAPLDRESGSDPFERRPDPFERPEAYDRVSEDARASALAEPIEIHEVAGPEPGEATDDSRALPQPGSGAGTPADGVAGTGRLGQGAYPVGMLKLDHVPDDFADSGDPAAFSRISEVSGINEVASPAPELRAADAEGSAAEGDSLSLPFRVRGQSLRPEQREPLRSAAEPDGYLPDDPPLIPSPEGVPLPSRPVAPAGAGQPTRAGAAPMSGSLLLPAFFRGARAARSKPPAPVAPSAREGLRPAAPSGPGDSSRPQTPSNWQSPVRRAFPDRSAAGAPPAMPEVSRSGGGIGTSSPAIGVPGTDLDPANAPSVPQTPSGGSRPAEPPREPPRLLGVWCDAGHVTSPDRPECRVCGLPVPPQAPILVARPPLGVLVFDNGDRVVVDRPVILGRDPKPVSSPDPEVPVLHPVQSATGQVSRTHAEVRASGWDVVITDLEAMNGTALTVPGASPVAIEPGVPTVLGSGARVDLGGESGFVFEIEG